MFFGSIGLTSVREIVISQKADPQRLDGSNRAPILRHFHEAVLRIRARSTSRLEFLRGFSANKQKEMACLRVMSLQQ